MQSLISTLQHMRSLRVLMLTAIPAIVLAMPSGAAKACEYRFTGHLEVEHHGFMQNFLGKSVSPLENVQLRISARRKVLGVWGNWAPQTTVRTEHDGRFSATINKNCAPRQFMIKARFHDPELEIRHAQAAQDPLRKKVKWYTLYKESSSDSGQGDVNETLTLRFSRAGDLALDDREPWYHAEIWSLYKTAIDQMASYGSRMEFEKQFAVKSPHNVNRNSYARPVNIPAVGLDVIYLVKNSGHDAGQDIEIMLHELMHIWAYQHSIMEDQMAYHLVEEFAESVVGGDAPSTHGMVDHTYVAWHEGFAEWAMEIVAKEISPNRSDTHEPWSTAALSNAGASTFDEVDRLDDGFGARNEGGRIGLVPLCPVGADERC